MKTFTDKRREFIAKNLDDLAKTIFAVGLAGGFFKTFSFEMRVVMAVLCASLLIAGFFVTPKGDQP
jgi:hypothetical protein